MCERKEKCGTCCFWSLDPQSVDPEKDPDHEIESGSCLRYPPVLVEAIVVADAEDARERQHGEHDEGGELLKTHESFFSEAARSPCVWQNPQTFRDHWCGEWKPAET